MIFESEESEFLLQFDQYLEQVRSPINECRVRKIDGRIKDKPSLMDEVVEVAIYE